MIYHQRSFLPGPVPALHLAFAALTAPEAPVFWRHPRARFVTVAPSAVTQLWQENSTRTLREVLHFGYEYLADSLLVCCVMLSVLLF